MISAKTHNFYAYNSVWILHGKICKKRFLKTLKKVHCTRFIFTGTKGLWSGDRRVIPSRQDPTNWSAFAMKIGSPPRKSESTCWFHVKLRPDTPWKPSAQENKHCRGTTGLSINKNYRVPQDKSSSGLAGSKHTVNSTKQDAAGDKKSSPSRLASTHTLIYL